MSEYEEQAEAFLRNTETRFTVKFVECGRYFDDDKESRDIFRFTFRRGRKTFSGKFGQSLNKSGGETPIPPTAYDVLTCLTKYDPGTFEEFCSDFGYDTDSRRAERTYKAVVAEWRKVEAFWTEDERKRLAEIQ